MDVGKLVDKLRSDREVWVAGPVRSQRRVAVRVKEQVPGALSEQLDPVTGIHAYTEPTPGTETRIYLPPAPLPTDSLGSVTPSR